MDGFPILSKIQRPQDLRSLTRQEIVTLSEEIRTRIIRATAQNGGHVGPNLGVVELTIA
ncbi:MAG: 1-deoxy-D-xylulose-5-phosphate synthase N-terminal domain-containing protein, partial [Verrucomicrobiota bacterium]|nr:1-deoxy-D-xylulose-5-phosphate synthase N-terminal domain-containing protein [Verrucomicrobiota bacterium]